MHHHHHRGHFSAAIHWAHHQEQQQQLQIQHEGHWSQLHQQLQQGLVGHHVPQHHHHQGDVDAYVVRLADDVQRYKGLFEEASVRNGELKATVNLNRLELDAKDRVIAEKDRMIERQRRRIEALNTTKRTIKREVADQEEKEVVLTRHREPTRDMNDAFERTVQQWEHREEEIEDVDLGVFLFNPEERSYIPQQKRKAVRNMDLFKIMHKIRKPNFHMNLAEVWQNVTQHERKVWSERCARVKQFQREQIQKGWIFAQNVHKIKGEPLG